MTVSSWESYTAIVGEQCRMACEVDKKMYASPESYVGRDEDLYMKDFSKTRMEKDNFAMSTFKGQFSAQHSYLNGTTAAEGQTSRYVMLEELVITVPATGDYKSD